MRWLASFFCLAAVFLAFTGIASAQQSPSNARVVASCGTTPYTYTAGSTVPILVDTNGNLCFGGSSGSSPVPTIPPKLTAYGTLAVSNSSVSLSTLTVGPNSPAWSTTLPNGYVTIRNSVNSTAVLYVCPLGGTCSSSVGEPIAIGETIVRTLASPANPTLICGSASACTAIAEE